MSKPEMPSREEMAEEFRKKLLGLPSHPNLLQAYADFEKQLSALLARRDEMVVKAVDELIEASPYIHSKKAEFIRALKEQLK